MLGAFSYRTFLAENLAPVLAAAGLPRVEAGAAQLPLGVSFFTFQAITYLVDVHRREAEVQRSPVNVALFISLFPQLIAEPIARHRPGPLPRAAGRLRDANRIERRLELG